MYVRLGIVGRGSVCALGCIAGLLLAATAAAAPGDIDTSFGTNGFVTVGSAQIGDSPFLRAMAIQADGKIVAAGPSRPPAPTPPTPLPNSSLLVVRLLSNGKPDPSFGVGGRASLLPSRVFSYAGDFAGIAIDASGRIVVAGAFSTDGLTFGAGFLRLLPDGSPDPSFNADGNSDGLIIVPDTTYVTLNAVATTPGGSTITAAGSSGELSSAVLRLTETGAGDATFAPAPGAGLRKLDLAPGQDDLQSVAVMADGRAVVAGQRPEGGFDVLAARVLPGGTLDPDFGTAGVTILDGGGEESTQRVVLLADGRIRIIAANAAGPLLAGLTAAGTPDAAVGGDGTQTLPLGSQLVGLAEQPDGKLLFSGITSTFELAAVSAVLRTDVNGVPDAGFGTGGLASFAPQPFSVAYAVAVQPGGGIVTTGVQATSTTPPFPNSQGLIARLKSVADPAAGGGPSASAGGADAGAGTAGGGTSGPVLCARRKATIVGTARSDRLRGTRRSDVIAGGRGNDVISGLGGNDVICGGSGSDRLSGGAGKDRLYGEAGRDTLRGDLGADMLNGGLDNDWLLGGAGRDQLFGGAGRDRLFGGASRDLLLGGPGTDLTRQ